MNRHAHKLIFNARRGQIMAVAETAQGASKGGSDAQSPQLPPQEDDDICRPSRLRQIALAVAEVALHPVSLSIGLALTLGFIFVTSARAQIVADPNAPGNQRPTVLAAPNGTPVVNIQTPSAAGVSRNTYRQFDVQSNGAILNNSRTNTQTQLGGWVQGNPWLATGSARVILNEVNSSNPSQLKGFIEVAGQRAEIIIANPAGINVDGAGFINASRATLTTGTPILNGGSLEGYRVQRGVISINGAGLDATLTDHTGILARAIEVNAGIWAKDLKLVTGVNDISADQVGVSANAAAAQGPIPRFARQAGSNKVAASAWNCSSGNWPTAAAVASAPQHRHRHHLPRQRPVLPPLRALLRHHPPLLPLHPAQHPAC